MREWTDEKIIKWHAETFPACTLSDQLLKLEKELQELAAETDDKKRWLEQADVYICAVTAWKRYGSEIGRLSVQGTSKMMAFKHKTEMFDKIIDIKMNVNAARRWERLPDGTYQHSKINKPKEESCSF